MKNIIGGIFLIVAVSLVVLGHVTLGQESTELARAWVIGGMFLGSATMVYWMHRVRRGSSGDQQFD